MKMSRRSALVSTASALAVAPAQESIAYTREVVLSSESVAVVQRLIDAGYHQTQEEVMHAAIEAFMARPDQWRPVYTRFGALALGVKELHELRANWGFIVG